MKTITKLILIVSCGLAARTMNSQSVTFNYTGSLQTWTVPSCVTQITIEALGAAGGSTMGENNSGPWTGGLGADIRGTFTVTPGQIITALVGQAGSNAPGSLCTSGGGGGSWVVNNSTLLLVAGGGGGGFMCNALGGINGGNGNAGNAGSNGLSACICRTAAAGGSGGNGGTSCYGGGGGGWLSVGTSTCSGAGGGAYPGIAVAGGGGYGGGGGGYNTGCCGGSGGGGGYSGGSGGTSDGCAGGGGGSYNIGSSPSNTAGVNAGNGTIFITWTLSSVISNTGNVINNVSCFGGSNGKASAVFSGGSAPFTYLWTPSGGTRDTANGLSAGTYTVSVTASCGSSVTAAVTITQPTVLAATATTTTNVNCNGGSTGATASTVTGGTNPYTYLWTGGSTNATATGLTAGSYTLSVTDKNGCSATASTVVTQPNALADSAFSVSNVLCHGGSTGSASNIAKGGNAPYTYLWTPGGATNATASGLSAGTYTLMVSDACGASATASATIAQPAALSIIAHSPTFNGSAAVRVSGGTAPYTYLWSPGGKTTDSISGLTKGTYCCMVRDANGCKDSACVVVSYEGIGSITGNSEQIVVYPNPNNGQFTIESTIGGASSVEIYNILGEKVFTRNLSTTKGANTINISNQPNGVYLYRVISESGDLLGEGKITLQK